MTPYEFATKWGQAKLSESAGSQEHFIDICHLVGEATPAESDPKGDFFTFEKSLKKESGRTGFADVWRKGNFGWEYKGCTQTWAKRMPSYNCTVRGSKCRRYTET